MKMSKIFSLILVVVMLVSMTACDWFKPTPPEGGDGLEGTYDVTLWVSEIDGVAQLTQSQIDAFEAANPGIVINASIEGVSEANAAGQVLNDVASAPDIYCFAQDQLARLVQASALSPLGEGASNTVRTNNDAGSVAAGSVAGKLYAYPMTSDNGYYLYYDTSIITNPDSLEDIIAACEANGKTFRYALENAWYTASFFFATGCVSEWTMDDTGKFTSVHDTFNSPEGLVAMKGMQKLAQSSCYDSNADIFENAGAIVTGIWNANSAGTHFGANLGATDLPSFTVDGQSYHLGSFTGNKLMGVKPQTDAKKGAVLHLLAQWLTNEEAQMARYNEYQWGPSNLKAQQSDAVQANVSLAALALQGNYGKPQGQIEGSWWDIAKVLGAEARNAKSDDDLQTALNTYTATIDAIFKKTEAELKAWSVIGSISGSNWDTDFPMTEVSEGVYESAVLDLKAGSEFKCRQGASWTVNYGSDGKLDGPNCTVEADGKYIVRLTLLGNDTAKIELIPQQ